MHLSKQACLKAYIRDQLCLLANRSSSSVFLELLFQEYYETLCPGSSFSSYDKRVSYYTDLVFLSVVDPFSLLQLLDQAFDFQSFHMLTELTSPSFFDRCLSFFSLRPVKHFGLNGRTNFIDVQDPNSEIQIASGAAYTYLKDFAKHLSTVSTHIKHVFDTTYNISVSTDPDTILHSTVVKVCAWKDDDGAQVFDYIHFTLTDTTIALAYDSSSLSDMSCISLNSILDVKGTVLYPLFIFLDVWLDLVRIVMTIQKTQLDIHDSKYAGYAVSDWSCGKTKEDIIHLLTELGALKHVYD